MIFVAVAVVDFVLIVACVDLFGTGRFNGLDMIFVASVASFCMGFNCDGFSLPE